MILNIVRQIGKYSVGVYRSVSTSVVIVYANRSISPNADPSTANIDLRELFRAMEILDRRKGRR